MTTLFAQPYDLSANGFYFETAQEYNVKVKALRNNYGQPVEEFEIQFIDGDDIDCKLAKAISLNQANAKRFLDLAEEWDDDQKTRFILAVGECGYQFDLNNDNPDDLDVDVYYLSSLHELAKEFVEEGIMGDIHDNLRMYFDYDALARDLAMDYSETTVAGVRIIYRCA